jgi:hypothetical protein
MGAAPMNDVTKTKICRQRQAARISKCLQTKGASQRF